MAVPHRLPFRCPDDTPISVFIPRVYCYYYLFYYYSSCYYYTPHYWVGCSCAPIGACDATNNG